MPSAVFLVPAVVLVPAALAAAVVAGDRLAAVLAMRRAARRIAALSGARSMPVVRVLHAPFLTQLIAGRYRDVAVSLTEFSAGGLEFSGLAARLTRVQVPLGRLLAGSASIIAGQVSATATIPLAALRSRLPAGLTVHQRGGELRVGGSILRVPVSGTLTLTAGAQRIVVTPAVLGVPSLVGFVITVPGLPQELAIESVRVTDAGLAVTMHGDNVVLGKAADQQECMTGYEPGESARRLNGCGG